eukprot:TRINITY_DN3585_c0_g1_i4.p1 TRINITY_DN3585_c0_g1~~TRINITY_DN3585_c0_g1_i4.p1  ORF type:complete len:1736 (+),score=561.04 TRINITY_DN3585_c0_g1_i4:149-5356(+)
MAVESASSSSAPPPPSPPDATPPRAPSPEGGKRRKGGGAAVFAPIKAPQIRGSWAEAQSRWTLDQAVTDAFLHGYTAACQGGKASVWNMRYQDALELLSLDGAPGEEARAASLTQVLQSFTAAVQPVAEKIVQELGMDDSQRTTRTTVVYASAAVYAQDGVVYHVWQNVAQAKYILRSIERVHTARVRGVTAPLCAVIYYRGVPLTAAACLKPAHRQGLGMSGSKKSEMGDAVLARLCGRCRIAPNALDGNDMCYAADGRMYVLDLHGLVPLLEPALQPSSGPKRQAMVRAEYVATQAEMEPPAAHLVSPGDVGLLTIAQLWVAQSTTPQVQALMKAMHSKGYNLCMLGEVRAMVKEMAHANAGPGFEALTVEIAARIVNALLANEFRGIRTTDVEVFLICTSRIVGAVLGNSHDYWDDVITPIAQAKYAASANHPYVALPHHNETLFRRICELSGCVFRQGQIVGFRPRVTLPAFGASAVEQAVVAKELPFDTPMLGGCFDDNVRRARLAHLANDEKMAEAAVMLAYRDVQDPPGASMLAPELLFLEGFLAEAFGNPSQAVRKYAECAELYRNSQKGSGPLGLMTSAALQDAVLRFASTIIRDENLSTEDKAKAVPLLLEEAARLSREFDVETTLRRMIEPQALWAHLNTLLDNAAAAALNLAQIRRYYEQFHSESPHDDVAYAYIDEGACLEKVPDLKGAETALRKAVMVMSSASGPDNIDTAALLLVLAKFYARTKHGAGVPLAIELSKQALDIEEKIEADSARALPILTDLAEYFRETSSLEDAEAHALRAAALARKLYASGPEVMRSFKLLVAIRSQRQLRAVPVLQRAVRSLIARRELALRKENGHIRRPKATGEVVESEEVLRTQLVGLEGCTWVMIQDSFATQLAKLITRMNVKAIYNSSVTLETQFANELEELSRAAQSEFTALLEGYRAGRGEIRARHDVAQKQAAQAAADTAAKKAERERIAAAEAAAAQQKAEEEAAAAKKEEEAAAAEEAAATAAEAAAAAKKAEEAAAQQKAEEAAAQQKAEEAAIAEAEAAKKKAEEEAAAKKAEEERLVGEAAARQAIEDEEATARAAPEAEEVSARGAVKDEEGAAYKSSKAAEMARVAAEEGEAAAAAKAADEEAARVKRAEEAAARQEVEEEEGVGRAAAETEEGALRDEARGLGAKEHKAAKERAAAREEAETAVAEEPKQREVLPAAQAEPEMRPAPAKQKPTPLAKPAKPIAKKAEKPAQRPGGESGGSRPAKPATAKRAVGKRRDRERDELVNVSGAVVALMDDEAAERRDIRQCAAFEAQAVAKQKTLEGVGVRIVHVQRNEHAFRQQRLTAEREDLEILSVMFYKEVNRIASLLTRKTTRHEAIIREQFETQEEEGRRAVTAKMVKQRSALMIPIRLRRAEEHQNVSSLVFLESHERELVCEREMSEWDSLRTAARDAGHSSRSLPALEQLMECDRLELEETCLRNSIGGQAGRGHAGLLWRELQGYKELLSVKKPVPPSSGTAGARGGRSERFDLNGSSLNGTAVSRAGGQATRRRQHRNPRSLSPPASPTNVDDTSPVLSALQRPTSFDYTQPRLPASAPADSEHYKGLQRYELQAAQLLKMLHRNQRALQKQSHERPASPPHARILPNHTLAPTQAVPPKREWKLLQRHKVREQGWDAKFGNGYEDAATSPRLADILKVPTKREKSAKAHAHKDPPTKLKMYNTTVPHSVYSTAPTMAQRRPNGGTF